MDKLNETISSFTGGGSNNQQQSGEQKQQGGGVLGGLGDKLNSAAGGGKESEKNEDMLDKGGLTLQQPCHVADEGASIGIDFVQEKFLGQGPQDNESAIEQAKDEQISDFIRDKYKSTTGSDMPIKDKDTKFG